MLSDSELRDRIRQAKDCGNYTRAAQIQEVLDARSTQAYTEEDFNRRVSLPNGSTATYYSTAPLGDDPDKDFQH